jgi:predicted unusual protein kinase regulating ubiquinone biosynthesis (AarF/ABC1/UbiB family)
MIWSIAALVALATIVLLWPAARRAAAVGLVLVWRLSPLALRKLGMGARDYTPARAVRLAFEDLGPTYIKFGQVIASTPTAFSAATTEEFARCLDEVRPISHAAVAKLLRAELGGGPEELFSEFNPEPLASASIAQVHTATLRSGRPVVVKVQRPGIRHTVGRDLALMRLIARMCMRASKLLRHTNVAAIVEDFARTIHDEMDFLNEAGNMEEFNKLLAREGLHTVARAPRVEREYTTGRVLTMERLFGVRIDDKAGVDRRVDDAEELLRTSSMVFWSCVFLGGFFHGDIHAGNIMVLDDGRLGYLDFGIVGRFSDQDRAALADWVGAMVSGDGEQLARAIHDMGAVRAQHLDWDTYVRDVTQIFLPLRGARVDRPEMLSEFFPRLREMGRVHDIHLPPAFILIIKQIGYFGRYVMMHAPHYNENTDPKSQANFVRIFVKYNAQRRDRREAAIRPSA